MPDGFRFAVKMPPRALRALGTFEERVRRLGDRLGPVRIVVESPETTGSSRCCSGRRGCRSRSTCAIRAGRAAVEPAVRVNDWEADAPFRYLRFREPPHSGDDLEAFAARIRALLGAGIDVFAYFRHEDVPTAPAYARRLKEFV